MSRSDAEILDDIQAAVASIHGHLQHGPISVEIVMDAVAMRLLEIGEAVKGLAPELIAAEPPHPGYWWLAYDPSNYRFSCMVANRRRQDVEAGRTGRKAGHFPIQHEAADKPNSRPDQRDRRGPFCS